LEKGYGRALVQTADKSEGNNIFVIGVPAKNDTAREWLDTLTVVSTAKTQDTQQIDIPNSSDEWLNSLNGSANGQSVPDNLPAPTRPAD